MEVEQPTETLDPRPNTSREDLALSFKPKEHKPTSLVVTHIPTDVSKREIEQFMGEVGQVRHCHLVRDKDWNFKGMVYVQYNNASDAERAKEILHKKQFMGQSLRVKFSRNQKKEKLKLKNFKERQSNALKEEHFGEDYQERTYKKKPKDRSKYDVNKEARKLRKGRIIIRNLSFKITEKLLEEHFSPYGKINEVKVVRKDGNKLAGYAFLQYETRLEALKAIQECNMKPLLGRPVVVDMAVPKKVFQSQTANPDDAVKEEKVDIKDKENDMKLKIKEEKLSGDEDSDSGLEDKDDSEESDISGEDESDGKDDSDDDEDSDDDDSDDDDSDDDDSDDDGGGKKKPKPKASKIPENKTDPSKDVVEERTIFIKNLNFDATEEDIATHLSNFGEVKSVVLVIDRLTEHPRGTAFAQFKDREAAAACIAAEADPTTKDQFVLLGRPMHIMKALSRGNLQDRKKDEDSEKKVKDKRNLYLAREGFVRLGTQAAVGVSPADINLRQRREQVKRRMLKNLNVFVSTTRLCINNLPEKLTDTELKKIFKEHGGPGSKVTEARVMKNLHELDENNEAKSRGYGFVTFTEHENALNALRTMNNNPSIFTKLQRPVIEFSLENREILHAKEKRLEKSREKNPLFNKGKNAKSVHQKGKDGQSTAEKDIPAFMGSKADPNADLKNALPSNIGAKVRGSKGKITRKLLKKQRLDLRKGSKKRLRVMDDTPLEPVTKKSKEDGTTTTTTTTKNNNSNNKKKKQPLSKNFKTQMRQEKSFNDMVNKYKQTMASANPENNSKKWYED